MLIDETAGSGGDLLPWMFRKFKVGHARRPAHLGRPGRHPRLPGADGRRHDHRAEPRHLEPRTAGSSRTRACRPTSRSSRRPADVIAGHDPQLEKAIEVVDGRAEEDAAFVRQAAGLPGPRQDAARDGEEVGARRRGAGACVVRAPAPAFSPRRAALPRPADLELGIDDRCARAEHDVVLVEAQRRPVSSRVYGQVASCSPTAFAGSAPCLRSRHLRLDGSRPLFPEPDARGRFEQARSPRTQTRVAWAARPCTSHTIVSPCGRQAVRA